MSKRLKGQSLRGAILVSLALPLSSAHAEDANLATVHARALSAPTEWCAADAGVPVIVTVDGPELYAGEYLDRPPTVVKVRRGADSIERLELTGPGPHENRVGRGSDFQTVGRIYPREEELRLLGRLRAEVRICDGIWTGGPGSASWSVVGSGGAVVRSGQTTVRSPLYFSHPFFDSSRRYPQAIEVGEDTLFVMSEPRITKTMEAFVSPEQEQSQ